MKGIPSVRELAGGGGGGGGNREIKLIAFESKLKKNAKNINLIVNSP